MIETIRLPVAGMTCVSCVSRITRSLRRLDGVLRVKVDLRAETVLLTRDSDRVSIGALAAAVADAGYEPEVSRIAVVEESVTKSNLLARLFKR